MAVSETGEVVGSVSGGCVESAVYEVAQRVLRSGQSEVVSYGVSDGDAFSGRSPQRLCATAKAHAILYLHR